VAPVAPDVIVAQVRAVAEDIGVDAVKIGMLGDEPTILAVQKALALLPASTPVVLDPVMVAESGAALLQPAAARALVERLLPRATVATPNLAEAAVLAGSDPDSDVEALARAVQGLGPRSVVITGGHREDATDVFYDGQRLEAIQGERFPDGASHGSGCTHSSALAAHLALGLSPLDAARRAREIAGEAVRRGLRDVGGGAGPVDALGIESVRVVGAASPLS
jgi:hydroxymethylpyrimidine/phosphomethylpyrimidine kinase